MDYEMRRKRLRDAFSEDGLEALILTKTTDIRYITGFTGEAASVILTREKDYMITDGRFENQAQAETKGLNIHVWPAGTGLFEETGRRLRKLGARSAALDTAEISYKDYMLLARWSELDIIDCPPYLIQMRRVKDKEELGLIRKACRITEQSFLELLNRIEPGQTEKEIRNILEYEFHKRGSVNVSFDTIVASGTENGANPHASLTDRRVERGDMITIDFGASYEGYCSDITRTIAFGKPDDRLVEIYYIVKEAKDRAVSLLKEGVMAKEIDAAAREVIKERGFYLPHGPGHGFGLDIHEDPFLGPKNEYRMEAGVVHTLEPGIYKPGLGGVRIEDDYLITEKGAELLTPGLSQELIIL